LVVFLFGFFLNGIFAVTCLLPVGVHLAFSFFDQSLDFFEFFHLFLQFILLGIAGKDIDDSTFCNTHEKFLRKDTK
jgi:hypothetical protein